MSKATSYVENKTGTKFNIERLFITFSGNIYLEGVYLEDLNGDTLFYSKDLEAGLAFMPLIKDGNVNVSKLDWEGVVANVNRPSDSENFNFNFLIEAFSPQSGENTTTTDTTSSGLQIALEDISLTDFNLNYQDQFLGISSKLMLGKLGLNIPELDLEEMNIEISEVTLSDTRAEYLQTKPFPESEPDTTSSTPFTIILNQLLIENVQLNYQNEVDQQLAEIDLQELLLKLPLVNLKTQEVDLDLFTLNNSSILFHDFSPSPPADSNADASADTATFSWPKWTVRADQLDLNENTIEYKSADTDFKKGYFNPEALKIDGLSAKLTEISLEENKAGAEINLLKFEEASGFSLKEFALKFDLTDQQTSFEDLRVALNRSAIQGDVKLEYVSIAELIEKPEAVSMDINLKAPGISIKDAYFFQPQLAQDTLIQKLEAYPFQADIDLDGSTKLLNISAAELSWGPTNLFTVGKFSDLLDVDALRFDIPQLELKSQREVITKFISEADLGIQLPESFLLTGQASGSVDDLGTELQLTSDLGDISLLASYQNKDQLVFDAKLNAQAIQLNTLLQNPDLDTVYFSLDAKGSGTVWYEMTADIQAKFDSLGLYQNDYSGLVLSGNLENGSGTLSSDLNSKNLRYDLKADVDLDSLNSVVNLDFNLEGADLGAMGLTAANTRAQLNLNATFEGNLEEFQASATFNDALVIQDQNRYPLGTIWLNALVENDSTSLDIESNPLVGFVQSNSNPGEFTKALTSYFNHYFAIQDSIQTSGDVILNLNFAIRQDPFLNEVLLPGLTNLENAAIKANFNEKKQTMTATVNFPFVNYGGAEIDSLGIQLDSDPEHLDFSLGFTALNTGPVAIDRTRISGKLDEALLLFDLQFYDQQEILTQISTEIEFLPDSVIIKFLSDNLILDKTKWDIPASNNLIYSNQEISLRDMEFTSRNQQVRLTDDLDSLAKPHLAAVFQGFKLENLTSFLNPREKIANGKVDGSLIVQNPFGALGILGELDIDSLSVLNSHLGHLRLDAEAKTLGNYALVANLSGGGADLEVRGEFIADQEAAAFDLEVDLNKIDLKMLSEIVPDQISQADGYFDGQLTASGTTADPTYEGQINFYEASLTPSILGTKYIFQDESIRLDNEGIYLDNFIIRDISENTFTLAGEITTESFVNPGFDLTLNAQNFMVINSTDRENELFYGTGTIDASIDITGDLVLPKVTGRLKVKDQTDLTFKIPESEVDLVERQGVVVFVNKENPDDILTRNDSEASNTFSGYDIRLLLEVDPDASFKIIIDPKSGDNLALSATGALNLNIDPIGRTRLSGQLTVQSGHYEMSLYNLVSRRFEINQGSTITWNGDPLDASMDITASYEVSTAAAPLMASQLTGSGDATQNQYNILLDFLVYLYLYG